jgi:rhodanese-related sulfurtransferase
MQRKGEVMTFEEVLDQAIALLQRRGRLTYRTLKRQFQLDDAVLEDLTVELITGQRLAVDEGGEVLVWSGAPEPPAVPAGLPAQTMSLNVPLNQLPGRVQEIPRKGPLVLHYQSGYRSAIVASFLERHGITACADLVGGFAAWEASQLAVASAEAGSA